MGAALLVETLAGLDSGAITPVAQNNADATLAPILKREDGLVDWSAPAAEINNRARGFLPWPGAWTTFRGQRLQIWRCRRAPVETAFTPGVLFSGQHRLLAACGAGEALELSEVQLEGRKRVTGADFLNGVRLEPGERLGL
jgi:methionyl-tRNA formyltransferase